VCHRQSHSVYLDDAAWEGIAGALTSSIPWMLVRKGVKFHGYAVCMLDMVVEFQMGLSMQLKVLQVGTMLLTRKVLA